MALCLITTIDLLPLPAAIRLLHLGIVFMIGKNNQKLNRTKKNNLHVLLMQVLFFWRIIICIKKTLCKEDYIGAHQQLPDSKEKDKQHLNRP